MRNITARDNSSVHSVSSTPALFLVGGLVSMFAMIAFGLILLACSYLKEFYGSNSQENNRSGQSNQSSIVYGGNNETMENIMSSKRLDEKQKRVAVIMAGDVTPTFIANPTSVSEI